MSNDGTADEELPTSVLIVDDSPEDRLLYRRLLSRGTRKYTVAEAESAADGLEECRRLAPECILLDYRLPDMTGLEFLAELEPLAQGSIAVVMLTGQGDERVAVEAMKWGAQDYLSKNHLTADALEQAIRSAIEVCALRRTVERQRRQLERSNRELERYARVVAHDLEAPLKAIRSGLAGAAERLRGKADPATAIFLEESVESADRMATLIRDILAYSRVNADTSARMLPLPPRKLLDVALANLKSQIEEARAIVEIGRLPETIVGDESQLLQLFQNLVGNAIKYRGPRVPHVRINAEPEGERWRFKISDNGIGINPEHASRIFDPFVRLHTAAEYEGTGVGLAICRAVVERHGGAIGVDSRPGEGSTFHFTLGTPRESQVSQNERAAAAPPR